MRGLLMIEPLYHQTRIGNKAMTRRTGGLEKVNGADKKVYGPQLPPDSFHLLENKNYSCAWPTVFTFLVNGTHIEEGIQFILCKPRYKVGEVVYLKEPISFEGVYMFNTPVKHRELLIWSNKLFMAEKDARAFIRITDIKCERLLDISDEDCKSEGIYFHDYEGWESYDKKKNPKVHSYGSPFNSFISLYRFANKISPKKETGNPWVWVYTFEYLTNYCNKNDNV